MTTTDTPMRSRAKWLDELAAARQRIDGLSPAVRQAAVDDIDLLADCYEDDAQIPVDAFAELEHYIPLELDALAAGEGGVFATPQELCQQVRTLALELVAVKRALRNAGVMLAEAQGGNGAALGIAGEVLEGAGG